MQDSNHDIPRFTQRFFRWICHDDFIEELEGDLLENFDKNVEDSGLAYARKQYRLEVLKMIRPSVIKDIKFNSNPVNFPIFLSHGKVAFRNLRRHKVFSFLNISGLAIGMVVSLLIISLISDLLKFDHFHTNKNNIYRVTTLASYDNGKINDLATSPFPLATVLKESVPGIENLTSIRRFFSAEGRANNKILNLKGHLVDQEFLDVFTFPMLIGDPTTALNDPFSLVITEKTATKFFGDEDPMDQVITMGSFGDFRVSGILRDVPRQSHLQFEVLGSMSSLPALEKSNLVRPSMEDWKEVYANYAYFSVNKGQKVEYIQNALNEVAISNYKRYSDLDVKFNLQPLLAITPGPELSNKIGPSMTFLPLIILSAIALLILLSACFNYTNLSIARSLKRAREVGLRKVIGAGRSQITVQFLIESVLISLTSLLLAIWFFKLIRPGFYKIIPRADQFNLELDNKVIFAFVVLAVFTGIIAGIIPSLILSKVKPVLVLKNAFSENIKRRFTLRRALITFQFVLSIIFIVGASIVFKQYKFSLNKDMGFDEKNILNVELFDTDFQLFQNEFSKIPEISDISFCSNVAGLGSTNSTWVTIENKVDSMGAYFISVNDSYIQNHNFKLLAGSGFSNNDLEKNDNGVVVNEAFLRRNNWEHSDALNQWVGINKKSYEIIGIVEDFNYTHLEESIKSFLFIQDESQYNIANLKIASSDISGLMARLEESWMNLDPNNSFQAAFLEEQLDQAYDFLKNAMTLFGFLAFLAISIACLGMLGMAMYAAETRAKEVSIRKVFGASIWNIFHSLSGNSISSWPSLH